MTRLAWPAGASLFLVLLAGALVFTGCDLASADDTLTLNAGSSIPPTIQHRFEYTRDDATEGGQVEVVSTIESRTLETILTRNGVTRDQVITARVDSVVVDRVSAPALTAADLSLGTDASGPRIGSVTFGSNQDVARDASGRTVTGAVKEGKEKVFAQFSVDDPGNIPPGGSVVRATVYFWVKSR